LRGGEVNRERAQNYWCEEEDDGLPKGTYATQKSKGILQWLDELTDCTTTTVDITTDPSLPNEYKIVVVPTILVMEDGEEVERFQANIMMTMEATKEDVQESIDNIIMSKF